MLILLVFIIALIICLVAANLLDRSIIGTIIGSFIISPVLVLVILLCMGKAKTKEVAITKDLKELVADQEELTNLREDFINAYVLREEQGKFISPLVQELFNNVTSGKKASYTEFKSALKTL